jgi:transcriptional regulator with GAF, ATPase, and Fis domain
MEVQIKLLRALQEREFERVGGTETIRVDVRVISATNRDLEEMIEDGTFREDLYYRLNVFPILLPPLRDRIDDLEVLAEHFIAKFARNTHKQVSGISPDALTKMRSYGWPGNVRELENIIERAMILVKGDTISPDDLAFARRPNQTGQTGQTLTPAVGDAGPAPSADPSTRPLAERLLEEEKREIVAAVDKSGGNIAGAARLLGINRSTLYYRMRKHGLEYLLPTKVGVGQVGSSDDDGDDEQPGRPD